MTTCSEAGAKTLRTGEAGAIAWALLEGDQMPKVWAQLQVVYSPDEDSAVIRFEGPRKVTDHALSTGMLHRVEPIYTAKGQPKVSVGVNEEGLLTQLRIEAGARGMLSPYLSGLFDRDDTE